MNRENANPIEPVENFDPFARFLRQVLRLSPLSFGLLVLFLNLVVDGWMAINYHIWVSPPDSVYPGLLQDFTALVVDLGSIPIIAGLYLWSTEGATRLFTMLMKSGVFSPETVVSENVDKTRPAFQKKVVFYLIAAVSVLYALSQLAAYQHWVPWQSAGGYLSLKPDLAYYRTLFWLLNFYTFLFAIYNIVLTVIILRRLFRTRVIRILPLHPDKCGGLTSISQYTLRIAYGIASAGLVISGAVVFALQTETLANSYPIILGMVAYIIFAPVLFFWPLGTAHTAMSEAKDAQLLELAQRFDEIYQRLKDDYTNDADFEKDWKKLENTKKIYGIAQDFPIWPFDTTSLQRFFAVVTAPLLPALVSIGIDMLTTYLFK
jgi:hypothetical protein